MNKILIADDHEMVRAGLKSLIAMRTDLTFVGEASNGADALKMFNELMPDVMLLDISLPDMNGMEVSKAILKVHDHARIIIFSMYNDQDYISRCMEYGVKGFVIKNDSGRELEMAITAVLAGKNYYSTQVQDMIFRKFSDNARKPEPSTVNLTKREIEIIKLLSEGLTSQEMADKLFISTRTVETHRANVMKKLNAKNAIELVKKSESMKLF